MRNGCWKENVRFRVQSPAFQDAQEKGFNIFVCAADGMILHEGGAWVILREAEMI